MPPKPGAKESQKKAYVMRMMPVSDASLMIVPEFAIEGWEERLYRSVEWSITGTAIRHHVEQCSREDIPEVSFSEAYDIKLKNSIIYPFLDRHSTLSLREHYDFTLAASQWDESLKNNIESKICYRNFNNIIDNFVPLIKNAVEHHDRSILERGILNTPLLRLNDCKLTHLDESLKKYPCLATLVLCGNYIKTVNCDYLPVGLRVLEMQANRISSMDCFLNLPSDVLYLGLSKNLLTNESLAAVSRLPRRLVCLDLSDNDIYDIEPLLKKLTYLPNLKGLHLAGNPCAMSAAYAAVVASRLPRLKYLDNRELLPTDRSSDDLDITQDDLKANYFFFQILRIISLPMPPKVEKGSTSLFHVELELPLLDSTRRDFLMTRRYESLIEFLPPPEDEVVPEEMTSVGSKIIDEEDIESEDSDIFAKMKPVPSDIIKNYTTFESPKLSWNKLMTFPEPTLKIFCPNLTTLRDTFRSTITLRLVYSETQARLQGKKPDKKSMGAFHNKPLESRVTIATIKCTLQNLDWSQPHQYFHWDDSLGTEQAIHWGDGDLRVLNYQSAPKEKKVTKGAPTVEEMKIPIPENLTCHFDFYLYSMQTQP